MLHWIKRNWGNTIRAMLATLAMAAFAPGLLALSFGSAEWDIDPSSTQPGYMAIESDTGSGLVVYMLQLGTTQAKLNGTVVFKSANITASPTDVIQGMASGFDGYVLDEGQIRLSVIVSETTTTGNMFGSPTVGEILEPPDNPSLADQTLNGSPPVITITFYFTDVVFQSQPSTSFRFQFSQGESGG